MQQVCYCCSSYGEVLKIENLISLFVQENECKHCIQFRIVFINPNTYFFFVSDLTREYNNG